MSINCSKSLLIKEICMFRKILFVYLCLLSIAYSIGGIWGISLALRANQAYGASPDSICLLVGSGVAVFVGLPLFVYGIISFKPVLLK